MRPKLLKPLASHNGFVVPREAGNGACYTNTEWPKLFKFAVKDGIPSLIFNANEKQARSLLRLLKKHVATLEGIINEHE